MSKVQFISVLSFLSFTFIVGILVFSRGFLLNRHVITDKSSPCVHDHHHSRHHYDGQAKVEIETDVKKISSHLNWCDESPKFPKLILLLVDALKFDFVQRMVHLSSIIARGHQLKHDDNGSINDMYSCLYKFVADPPTTTMQRLKALTTGTMPTFIDASANFNSYEIEEDSLIYQLYVAGKRIAFLGDDTWLNLFPLKYFSSRIVEAHPSFNAWDLDTVDLAVNESIHRIVSKEHENDWDILITHVLGVDHCGHRYGPNHPEMARKLMETDDMIKFVFDSMSNDTLLVIFGDHGMTNTGDHGGDSTVEVESALILITKLTSTTLSCPKSLDGQHLEISQIDLVPTIASLTGIPIPYSNIGQLIPNLLLPPTSTKATLANIAQMHHYVTHYSGGNNSNSLQSSVQKLFDTVDDSFQNYNTFPNVTTESAFQVAAQNYFTQVKSTAKNTWTQFNVPVMYIGITISFISVVCTILYVSAIPLFEEANVKYSVSSWLWPSLAPLWSIMSTCLLYSSPTKTRLLGLVLTTSIGLLVFLTVICIKLESTIKRILSNSIPVQLEAIVTNNSKHQSKKKVYNSIQSKNLKAFQYKIEHSEIVAVILYVFTCLGVFSNSFIINEGYILGSVLIAVVCVHLLCSRSSLASLGIPVNGDIEDNKYIVKLPVVRRHFKCCWSSFIFLAFIVRISQVFFRCREELQDCQEEFLLHKQLSSLPDDWVVNKFIRYGTELVSLAVFVVIFRHWLMYRHISASSRPSAIIARYIPTFLVVLNCAFRALQGLPFASSSSKHIRPFVENLPRVFYLVTASSLAFVWFKPLCCIGRLRPFSRSNSKITNSIANEKQQQQQRATQGMLSIPHETSQNIGSESSSTHSRRNCPATEIRIPSLLYSDDYLSEDVFTSIILTVTGLLTLVLVQMTSEGMSPSIPMIVYTATCLVGVYRSTPSHNFNSWSAVISWTFASQYFSYATGHQPVFSTLPWDAAFVASSNSSLGSSPNSILSWISPVIAVLGHIHASQILFAFMLPLLIYWKDDKEKPETLMGWTERRNVFIVCGKFTALHALKLLSCMACAAWQRRHLMVWKIFAPKLIFETVSFIITSGVIILTLVFVSRIDYTFQRFLVQERKNKKRVI